MRAAVLSLLTACGRISFDAQGGGLSDAADARVCSSAIGHDEDGDTIDDACDGCPHIPDALQPDSDGDGVDDACDPHPTTPTDHIVFFDGFGGAARPEWTAGAYSFVGDSLYVDARSTDFFMSRSDVLLRDTITIGGSVGGGAASNRILELNAQEAGPPVYVCAFEGSATTNRLSYNWTTDGATYTEAAMAPLTGALQNTAFALTLQQDADVRCTTTWPPTADIRGPFPPSPNAIGVAIYAHAIELTLDYQIQIRTD